MAKILYLRDDYDAAALRTLARCTADSVVKRRLLALAAVYDGSSRLEAAQVGGVGRQILRDWVLRFNAEGEAGLYDRQATNKSKLSDGHIASLNHRVMNNPYMTVDEATYFMFHQHGLSLSPRAMYKYYNEAKALSESKPYRRSTSDEAFQGRPQV